MYKSELQELCHQKQWSLPKYCWMIDGPDHSPNFSASVRVKIASVRVNGVSFDLSTAANSSKEAQNDAAKLAFLHFTSPPPALENASSELDCGEQMENKCIIDMDNLPIPTVSNDLLHQYKNQLQNYCHFYDVPLPAYSVYPEGPSHACLFRATVSVNGVEFRSSTFCKTVKEQRMLLQGLLWRLCHQMELKRLALATTRVNYRSWLRENAFLFHHTKQLNLGKAARSKRQAEINAAMVALAAFENRKSKSSGESKEPASPEVTTSGFESFMQSMNPTSALKKPSSLGKLISSSIMSQQQAEESQLNSCGESKQPAFPRVKVPECTL